MIFNKLRNNFSKKEINEARKNVSDKDVFDEYLERLKQKDSLTEKEKRRKKCYTKKLEEAKEYIKKLKEDLSKFRKHQYTNNEDLKYKGIKEIKNIFNKINEEDYYEPIKTKSAFNDDYMEYESIGHKDNNLTLEQYLNIIRSYLIEMIDNHKAQGEWKIQLVMKIIFVSSLDEDETRTMHTKSNNIEIMSGIETNDITDELFTGKFRNKNERE